MTTPVVSPVRAAPQIREPLPAGDWHGARSAASVPIDASEPVFEGHYPNFPIFPGVCVVECAHRAAVATADDAGTRIELAALESARFLGPVFPGDRIDLDLRWTRVEDGWRCAVLATTGSGDAAKIRLRYRTDVPR